MHPKRLHLTLVETVEHAYYTLVMPQSYNSGYKIRTTFSTATDDEFDGSVTLS